MIKPFNKFPMVIIANWYVRYITNMSHLYCNLPVVIMFLLIMATYQHITDWFGKADDEL